MSHDLGVTASYSRVAVFGCVFSNHLALRHAIADARERQVDEILCLGDLCAFGPAPDNVFPILEESSVRVLRGELDDSTAGGISARGFGYTDPRDNYFAALSHEYTFANTSPENRRWLATLPSELRFQLGDLRVLCSHGSPRRVGEFLWESATPTHFLRKLMSDHNCDVLLASHTGIHWDRLVADGKWFVNVGAIGRPPNNGRTEVWYAVLTVAGAKLDIEFVPVVYDHDSLADEMRDENLPQEFVNTIRTGWWTTFLEALPARERARGRF